jgi:hypothetical protein
MVNRRELGRGIRRNPNVFLQQANMEYIMQACARGKSKAECNIIDGFNNLVRAKIPLTKLA